MHFIDLLASESRIKPAIVVIVYKLDRQSINRKIDSEMNYDKKQNAS